MIYILRLAVFIEVRLPMENAPLGLSSMEISSLPFHCLEPKEKQKHPQRIGGGLKKIGQRRTFEKWEKMQHELGYR